MAGESDVQFDRAHEVGLIGFYLVKNKRRALGRCDRQSLKHELLGGEIKWLIHGVSCDYPWITEASGIICVRSCYNFLYKEELFNNRRPLSPDVYEIYRYFFSHVLP